ncbi:MAG: superoxide dismutase family protein [Pseudonocardiaceae bacterium]|nr:superoxide dismutase family protein [Pseudonocardiaceae bacterium]
MVRSIRGAALAVLAAALTACSGQAGGDPAPGGTGMGGMNMGDPDAVPAEQVPGAEVAGGRFELLGTAPQGYQGVAGTAALARHGSGSTVTIELRGLKPGTRFISHVHEGRCEEGGVAHYKFDPAGGDMPPNEIHLAFVSTPEGTGYMTAENDKTAGPDARSVVVHPSEFTDNRIACAPLS